jgi:hypothetical protein
MPKIEQKNIDTDIITTWNFNDNVINYISRFNLEGKTPQRIRTELEHGCEVRTGSSKWRKV